MTETSQALKDVLAERERQRSVEGFTAWHDDASYSTDEMARAAACYALGDATIIQVEEVEAGMRSWRTWPWTAEWWKPRSARQNLIKAAALLLAEIERLDRAAARSKVA